MREAAPPAAGTIVARNYLPAARVLAESYLRHHPGAEFAVLVVDAEDGELDQLAVQAPGLRILGPAQLDLDYDEYARMAFAYSVTELCTAVKPWLLRVLLTDHDAAIYLDPDIEVFGPFGSWVGELAREHDIVLTPHVLEPMPRDGLRPSEADIMASGVFNLGFIGVARAAEPFLEFWAHRLRQDAISSVAEQLFTDQRWVDNVPALFRHTVITDPGFNVAYWNVYQRPLVDTGDGITAAGESLKFLHYSGYRPEKPWLVSTHFADRPRVLLSENRVLAALCAQYRAKLIEAGYADALDDVPYRWNSLPEGTRISPSLRRAFRQEWVDAERSDGELPPSPFGSHGAQFLAWATGPATGEQRRAGLNRWLMAVWQYRADLQHAFPDPLHGDAENFRNWCAESGVDDGDVPASAIPARPASSQVQVRDEQGANVLGYLTAELGVGEMGRLVHDAVAASGVPLATAVEESTVHNRTAHPLPAGAVLGEPRFPVSVLCVNADMTGATLRLHDELGRDRYVIGVWSWELEDFPPAMHHAFGLVDEVWTISDFCAKAMAEHSPVPVRVFPVPVRDPLHGGLPAPRTRGPVRVLFAFDHNSIFDRKNPLGAITAFQRAFPGRDDVRLTIKSINGDKHPADRERLRAAAAGDPRVELIEGYLSATEVHDLFADADCYLSLHRSEGFGLTVAEAMAHGLPVVSTDYSGSAEFAPAGVGWPVPYTLVPVGRGKPPYPADALWAEPDLDAAAAALREVAGDRRAARRRGAAAREHVLTTRTMAAAADWVRERIEQAHEQWRARRAISAAPEGPVAAVHNAREALRWRADPGMDSKTPMASALRKAVLRTIDHYDHHQRTVLGALMDGVESGVGELVARQDETAEQLGQVERRTGRLERNTSAQSAAVQQTTNELAKQLAAERLVREELTERLAELEKQLPALDHKVIDLLRERDERLGTTERALTDLGRTLPALRAGLLRHHDLLDPPTGETAAVATDVGVLRLPADDTVVLPWMRTYGTWEADEARLLDVLLPRGGVFVDIGAHVGYFTVRALQRTGRDGLVVAVEPWAKVRDLLERNVATNVPAEVAATLTTVAGAAWDEDGPLKLALAADGNSGDNRIDAGGDLEVDGVRLDGLPALDGRRIDVVKSDAQGRDHIALAGLTALFEIHRPHVLCEFDPGAIEEAGDKPAEVLRQYRAWGFTPVPVTAALVAEISDTGSVPSTGPAQADDEIVDAARATDEGFVSLWLRPGTS